MKLVHPKITSRILLSEQQINTLIIESPGFLYEFVNDLKKQMNNLEGETVLSLHDEPVSIYKNGDMISDPLSFEINNRKILTKVLSAMEKYSLEDVYYEQTQKLVSQIEAYINELSLKFDADIICENISFQHILKAAGISIADDYEQLIDRIYAYMELVREFEGDKLFIVVNLGSFVEREQLQEFADTVIGHSYRVLLVESHEFMRLKNENRLIIDHDLCEF